MIRRDAQFDYVRGNANGAADGEAFCAVGFIDKIDVGKIYLFWGWRRILKKILAVRSIA
jgi:hypothetical protein